MDGLDRSESSHYWRCLAGGAEFFGGLALLVSLLVRLASAVLAFAMLVAIFSVHISNGLFTSNRMEFALALLAVAKCR